MARIVRAVEAVKFAQTACASEKLRDLQQEQLELQQKNADQLRILLEAQTEPVAHRERLESDSQQSAENDDDVVDVAA